ncbi:MAG: ergothioneine biosynthesis protein EgtB [Bdellovibrionales bacterium]
MSTYSDVRSYTKQIVEGLAKEDMVISCADFVSPIKWHLGHTTWFFEEFICKKDPSYKVYNDKYSLVFNSYYKSLGSHWDHDKRSQLSKPYVDEIFAYREHVDQFIENKLDKTLVANFKGLMEIGIHHEQQHQEIIFQDIKYNFSQSPFESQFSSQQRVGSVKIESGYHEYDERTIKMGKNYGDLFCFDNETPEHKKLLLPFSLMNRPVTNGDYLDFIESGSIDKSEYWLSDAWDIVGDLNDKSPLYWRKANGGYEQFTFNGWLPLDLNAPLEHINFYEAKAFASYKKARLPKEEELEFILATESMKGTFCDQQGILHNEITDTNERFYNLHGGLWEWTESAYLAYPSYKAPSSALGEYNAKFMVNQFVLRGGSLFTPKSHYRNTYRNFYHPHQAWQFSGLRLAKDI